jgi:hypothetical protein
VLLAYAAPWLRFVLTIALAKGITVLGILLLLRAGQVSFGHAHVCRHRRLYGRIHRAAHARGADPVAAGGSHFAGGWGW